MTYYYFNNNAATNEKLMNKTTITKVLNRVLTQDAFHSLGFRRLISLPKKTRTAFNTSSLIGGAKVSNVMHEQKVFLSNLSDIEFYNWLKVN